MAKQRFGDSKFLGNIGFHGFNPIRADLVLGNMTQGAVTLAVSPAGSDAPSANRPARVVSGDYSLFPFATAQAAIDSLPRILRHAVVVNLADNFNVGGAAYSCAVEGFHCGYNANLSIRGVRGLPNLGGQPVQNLSPTSVAGRVIDLSTANWVIDELVGRFVNVKSGPGAGQVLIIAANTATSITLASLPSPAMTTGSVFDIEEIKSTVTGAIGSGLYGVGIFQNVGSISISDVYISAGTFRLVATTNTLIQASRISTVGGTYGILGQDCDACRFNQIGAVNAAAYGISAFNVGQAANDDRGWLAKGCAYGVFVNSVVAMAVAGVYIRGPTNYAAYWVYSGQVTVTDLLIDGGQTGILAWALSFLYLISTEIKNVTVGPFSLSAVRALIYGPLTGSGNAGWGLYAKGVGNTIELQGTNPAITGAAGEVTVDGSTDVTWSALSLSGNYSVAAVSGARIARL